MSSAETRTAKPESLEAKFKLLAALPYDRRAKRKHSLVYGFILDWYHSKYGDALASVRHVTSTLKERDPAGVGLYAGDVHAALSDLVAWGYLDQEKGTGRRASRYVPNWDLARSVHKTPNTTDDEFSVRENANTFVRENANATPDSVRDSMNEDPSTVTRPQDGVTERWNECAAPTAPPPVAGLSTAPAAETSQDATEDAATGFDQLWSAYGYKKSKPEARRAYNKLAPDAELHERLVDAARDWQQSWAAQGKEDAPRFTLAKWIEREEYECTPPTAYKAKARKAKAANDDKPSPRGKGRITETLRILAVESIGSAFSDFRIKLTLDGPNGDEERVLKVLTSTGPGEDNEPFNKLQRAFGSNTDDWPSQRLRLEIDGGKILDIIPEHKPDRRVEIVEADLIDMGDGEKLVALKFADADGKPEGGCDIVYEADSESDQNKGREQLGKLLSAVGLPDMTDTDELVGRSLMLSGASFFRAVDETGLAAGVMTIGKAKA